MKPLQPEPEPEPEPEPAADDAQQPAAEWQREWLASVLRRSSDGGAAARVYEQFLDGLVAALPAGARSRACAASRRVRSTTATAVSVCARGGGGR